MTDEPRSDLINTRSQQIGKLGEDLVKTKLPRSWAKNDHHHDFGKDLLIETTTDGFAMSGESFFIQVKSTEGIEPNTKGFVTCPIETRYASYYLDKVRDLPVFLVHMDVLTGNGWWLFLQPYLKRDQSWRTQADMTISIPLKNTLDDLSALAEEVKVAKRVMRIGQSTSIADAIECQKNEVSEIDPRLKADVTVVDGRTRVHLKPQCEITFTLKFKYDTEEDGDKVKDLFGKGKEVQFEPEKISVEGMPLFERLTREGGSLQINTKIPAIGQLVPMHDEVEGERLDGVRGHLTGGRDELWFEGQTDDGIFAMRFGPIDKSGVASTKVNLKLDTWLKETVCRLSHFDSVAPFYSTANEASVIYLQLFVKGNKCFHGTISGKPVHPEVAEFVRTLQKIRFIFNHVGCDAPIPEAITERMHNDMEVPYALLKDGQFEQAMPDATFGCISPTEFKENVDDTGNGSVKLESTCTFDIFGVKISCEIERIVTPMRMTKCEKTDEGFDIDFHGNKDTVCTARLTKPDDPQPLRIEKAAEANEG